MIIFRPKCCVSIICTDTFAYARRFFQYNTLLISLKHIHKLGKSLWHLRYHRPRGQRIQVFLHTNCLMASQILDPSDQVPHMCGRYPYRLAWRDQAMKMYQYFQTPYWMTWNPDENMLCQSILGENVMRMCSGKLWVKSSCRKYAAPSHMNGKF